MPSWQVIIIVCWKCIFNPSYRLHLLVFLRVSWYRSLSYTLCDFVASIYKAPSHYLCDFILWKLRSDNKIWDRAESIFVLKTQNLFAFNLILDLWSDGRRNLNFCWPVQKATKSCFEMISAQFCACEMPRLKWTFDTLSPALAFFPPSNRSAVQNAKSILLFSFLSSFQSKSFT